MLVVTRAELRKTLFVVFFILGSLAAYPLLTPEETRDFSRVRKEFRVLALQDGKPLPTTLATLPKGATYLLPANSYELSPDVHKVVVLEKTAAWQLVEYNFDNTVSTVSRYRAFRDRIEPVSHRMTFHPGLSLVFVALIFPAALLAFLGSLLWKAPPPPAPAAPQRNAWTEIVAIVRGTIRALGWARSTMTARRTAAVALPAAEQKETPGPRGSTSGTDGRLPEEPAADRRFRIWVRVVAAVVFVTTALVTYPMMRFGVRGVGAVFLVVALTAGFLVIALLATGLRAAISRWGWKWVALPALVPWIAVLLVLQPATVGMLAIVFIVGLWLPLDVARARIALGMLLSAAAGLFLANALVPKPKYIVHQHHAVVESPRDKVADAVRALWSPRREIDEFYRKHGRLPRDLKDLTEGDLPQTPRPTSLVVRETRDQQGMLTEVMTDIEPGRMIILRAKPAGDKLEWTCIVRGVPAWQVPHACNLSR